MCRNTLSVGWDGTLYDCDFNQMLELPVSAAVPRTIFDAERAALESRDIEIGPHCFGCTAGAGSSCGGALAGSSAPTVPGGTPGPARGTRTPPPPRPPATRHAREHRGDRRVAAIAVRDPGAPAPARYRPVRRRRNVEAQVHRVDHEAPLDEERGLVERRAAVPEARRGVPRRPDAEAQLSGDRGARRSHVRHQPPHAEARAHHRALAQRSDDIAAPSVARPLAGEARGVSPTGV